MKCPKEFPLSIGTSSSRLESLEWVVDHNNNDVKGIHIHNSVWRNKIGSSKVIREFTKYRYVKEIKLEFQSFISLLRFLVSMDFQ